LNHSSIRTLALVSLAFVAALPGRATIIDFDTIIGPVALTNQFASQGVMFSGIEATGQFATSVAAVSTPNYATPFYSTTNPGLLWFVDPANPSQDAYVTSVSITLNGYNNVGGWFDGATIEALDEGGNVIAGQTQVIPPTNGTDYGSTIVTFSGPVHALEFDNILNSGRLGIFPFDNLTFGAESPVPEPSSWLLVLSVIVAAWFVRRRKQRATTPSI
jgi:hypothetical protein